MARARRRDGIADVHAHDRHVGRGGAVRGDRQFRRASATAGGRRFGQPAAAAGGARQSRPGADRAPRRRDRGGGAGRVSGRDADRGGDTGPRRRVSARIEPDPRSAEAAGAGTVQPAHRRPAPPCRRGPRCRKADFQRVGGQFVADRGLRQVRHRGDEARQISQIEIVAGIDDQPAAPAREAVSAQARNSAAPSPARKAAA